MAQSHSSAFNFTPDTRSSRSVASSAVSSAGLVPPIVASNPLNLEPDDPDLRVSAASANTPQVPTNALAAATGTPSPSATPRAGTTPGTTPSPSPNATATRSPTPTATRPPGSAPDCDNSQSDIFCVYTVQPGDTLSGIAEKFGLKGNDDVTASEILANSNKPDIVDEEDLLQISQKLRIPKGGAALAPAPAPAPARTGTPPPGTTPQAAVAVAQARAGSVIHTVLSTETLIDIANKYGVESLDIVSVNRSLSDPNRLAIGQEILIPNPKRFAPAAVAAPVPAPASGGSTGGGSAGGGGGASNAPAIATGPRSASGLMWPTSAPISSYFGPKHPLGIDIDLYANPNASIAAAAAGTVTFAGGNTCCSYGLYVIVDHGNGLQTLYAHLSKINVTTGAKVSQGQSIGNGGRTGYATGNHLHFEVRRGGTSVNPIAYLP